MNVLLYCHKLPPDVTVGIGSYAFQLAQALTEEGHNVTVLTGDRNAPPQKETADCKVVRTIDFKRGSEDHVWWTEHIAEEAYNIVKQDHIDICEFPEFNAPSVAFTRNHPDFPVLVRLHMSHRFCSMYGRTRLRHFVHSILSSNFRCMDKLEQEACSRASVCSGISQAVIEKYREQNWNLGKRTVLVPNFLSTDPAVSNKSSTSRPQILFVGRLDRLKGADLLPRVIRNVCSTFEEVKFTVVGPGNTARFVDGIPPHLRHNVTVTGPLPHVKVMHLQKEHDIGLCLSTIENFPYVILEYMSNGLCVLNAAGGGAQEIGTHGENIVQVRRDSDSVSNALVDMVGNAEFRMRISSGGVELVRRKYSSRAVIPEMIRSYELAIAVSNR